MSRSPVLFRVVSLVLVALAAWPALAQRKPLDRGIQEEVAVVLMEVPVVARDANGRPVKDLTRDDLIVRVRGEVIDVKHLDPVVQREADADLPEVKLFVKIGSEYAMTETEDIKPQYYMFFIDLENNDLLARDRAREQIKDFIREQATDRDRISVVSFDGQLNLEQSFTTDRDGLVRAVDRAFARSRRPGDILKDRIGTLISQAENCEDLSSQVGLPGSGDVALAASGSRLADDECLIAAAHEYRMINKPRVESFMRALQGTVSLTAGVHDRVTVFAYTHGVSIDETQEIHEAMAAIWGLQVLEIVPRINTEAIGARLMEQVLANASAERVAFHFIDTAKPPTDAVASSRRGVLQAWTRPMEVAFEAPQSHSGAFAEATGGSLWIETDVSDALNKAIEFEEGRYWLGVYLDPSARKRLPKIRIQSKREGVTVTHGRGRVQQSKPDKAVRASVVTGEAVALAESDRRVLPFKLGFPSSDLDYQPEEQVMRAQLTLHLVLHDETGQYLASSYHQLEHAYDSSSGKSDQAVLVLRGGLEAPPGTYRLVALVQNTLTGKSGRIVKDLMIEPGT